MSSSCFQQSSESLVQGLVHRHNAQNEEGGVNVLWCSRVGGWQQTPGRHLQTKKLESIRGASRMLSPGRRMMRLSGSHLCPMRRRSYSHFYWKNSDVDGFTAKDICIIGFWAGKSGLKTLEPLGLRPGTASGNYRRHLDSFQKSRASEESLPAGYIVPIPALIRSTGERGIHPLTCLPPHELLIQEMETQDIDALRTRGRRVA